MAVDLSIVIPARNESSVLAQTLERLSGAGIREIIVADGSSDDATVTIAQSYGAHVVVSKPGRGSQLNAGAAIATGNMLLFLHADTQLPRNFEYCVEEILQRPYVAGGAFQLHIDSARRVYRLIEKMVAYRSRWLQLPYGDQAIFVRAATFHLLSGFPELSVMEDFVFARRLRKLGSIHMAPLCVNTSSRRWESDGVCRTTWLNQAVIAGYWLGVSPARLARWRYGVTHSDLSTVPVQALG